MEAVPCKGCTMRKEHLNNALRNFRKTCAQISLLNRHHADVSKRYMTAKKDDHRIFRYRLRMRMSTIEGVREMYIDYAIYLADFLADLRSTMVGQEADAADEILGTTS